MMDVHVQCRRTVFAWLGLRRRGLALSTSHTDHEGGWVTQAARLLLLSLYDDSHVGSCAPGGSNVLDG